MKIMMTGANGFLGSHLKSNLLKNNVVSTISLRHNNLSLVEEQILQFKPEIFIHCGWSGGNSFADTDSFSQFDNVKTGAKLFKTLSKLKDNS